MKINGSSDPLRIDRSSTPAAGGTKSADKAGSTPDTVQLSGLAAQLARLVDENPGASFDQARVDAIKNAIRSGEFHVDSGVVADRLLQSVQELVAK
jgi:negative regulator of flagellin synthesis FlgM